MHKTDINVKETSLTSVVENCRHNPDVIFAGLQESGEGVRQILHTLSRAGLPKDIETYADIFKKFGYHTKAAGKW